MKDLAQCTIIHDNFQRWLVQGKASLTFLDRNGQPVCPLVKVDLSPNLEYLYHTPFQDGSITWNLPPVFVGVYKLTNGGNSTLYLTPEFAGSSICQQAELVSPDWKGRPTMKEEIVQRVGQYIDSVIANDRHNLSVRELSSWPELMEYKRYLAGVAKSDAEEKVFCGDEPDGQFRHGYTMEQLPEDTFLAYLQSPEDFVKGEAERYMLLNQEDFLLQFLKNEALMAEYHALMQDLDNPLHRKREITRAVIASGAKTVSVTIQRDAKELTFKTEADSLLGLRSSYNISSIVAPDRRRFEQEFGRSWDYSPEEITRITYGRNTIYEAPPDQTEDMTEHMEMGGIV